MKIGQRFVADGLLVPTILMRWPGVSSAAKLVYSLLSQFSTTDGRVQTTVLEIEHRLGLTKKEADQALSDLVRAKLIKRINPPGVYEFIWHSIFEGTTL